MLFSIINNIWTFYFHNFYETLNLFTHKAGNFDLHTVGVDAIMSKYKEEKKEKEPDKRNKKRKNNTESI